MKLDAKDLKIIQELDLDPRITTSKLAKRVRLSQQVVDYRIRRLVEQGIIRNFGIMLNFSALGLEQYSVLFTIGRTAQRDHIIEHLKTHPSVYWAASVGNKWDLYVVLIVKDYPHFEQVLEQLFEHFPDLKDYDALYTLHREAYCHTFLHQKQSKHILMPLVKPVERDELDEHILQQLKKNIRTSSLEIGRHCNTSYKTVQNRIKRMEQGGVIAGYRLFVNSEAYGYLPYILLISFNSYGRDAEKKLLSYAQENPHITQASKLFGKWSLLFHLRVSNAEDLQKIIIDMRNKCQILGDYEIVPIFHDIAINHYSNLRN